MVISLFAIMHSVNQKNINEIKLWKTKYAQVSQYEEHLNEIEMGEMLEWQKENK